MNNPDDLCIGTALTRCRIHDPELAERLKIKREDREIRLAAATDAPPRTGWRWSRVYGWLETVAGRVG